MEIIKVAFFALTALFIYLLLKQINSNWNAYSTCSWSRNFSIYDRTTREVIDFINDIANKTNIDTVYIGIV